MCKLVDMGLLTGVAVRSSRFRDKLEYLCHGNLQSKAISPLQDLIVTVASQGSTKIKLKSHRSSGYTKDLQEAENKMRNVYC